MSVTFLYLLGNRQYKVLKIGVSRSPAERLRDLQKYNPYELSLFAQVRFDDMESAVKCESELHRWLRQQRLHGEWFKLTGLAANLVSTAEQTPTADALLRAVDFRDAVIALESRAR